VLIDEGRVVAVGQHRELLDTSERYREVLAAWAVRDDTAASDRPAASDGPAASDRPAASRTPAVGGE
jgi:hypothetical protein